MGSKRAMLRNGLGEAIVRLSKDSKRVVDLFCGSAAIAHFAALNTTRGVLAVDLQAYAVALASAVIVRTRALGFERLRCEWIDRARQAAMRDRHWKHAQNIWDKDGVQRIVLAARELCGSLTRVGPLWSSYGGYYFSPAQALAMDSLLRCLPEGKRQRSVCLAALIATASRSAAAPGHTAQPFQPTPKGASYLLEAWKRDPFSLAERYLEEFCHTFARERGEAFVGDAVEISAGLRSSDLVIVDPPYSDVQYSRFYHVLETVALGECGSVSGAGRYPPPHERPKSKFSRRSESQEALGGLMNNLAKVGATIIFTFPVEMASNGISGSLIEEMARQSFEVENRTVVGTFSTMGGDKKHRQPRQVSRELLLVLRPRL
jgi:adenine-specific DNA-methyltransferase